jgi:hypothetical protein
MMENIENTIIRFLNDNFDEEPKAALLKESTQLLVNTQTINIKVPDTSFNVNLLYN